ncbi:NAD(P)/FAD-dependent oxidoreductase [Acidiphilium sp. C61]|uniref:NAD(P)/FAD-dependent oxidoreductase n=1 Tax=Acidiphilium sp. C61 TaxID=1671485 RepID=UPI00157B9C50|nr:FAD-dependent oxidoreductase [Acidiphilium sp. C61]
MTDCSTPSPATPSPATPGPAVAVIGAGAAGLAAARRLAGTCAVTVFDKARGPGGRLAHRRREGFAFDFGAPFFTARDPRFTAELARLRAAGIVTPWACRFAEIEAAAITHRRDWGDAPAHYVPIGRMSRLTAHWAEGLDIRQNCRIAALHPAPAGWTLESEAGERFGPFAFVVLALPAPQAAALLPETSMLRATAASARMQGAFSLMLGLAAPLDPGFDAALVRDGVLSWISLCAARPGHEGGPGLVAISRNSWADDHLEDDPATIRAAMLDALAACLGETLAPVHLDLHRWRYANAPAVAERPRLIDAANRLALCGDWTAQGKVEAAYLSGLETAEAVLARLAAS